MPFRDQLFDFDDEGIAKSGDGGLLRDPHAFDVNFRSGPTRGNTAIELVGVQPVFLRNECQIQRVREDRLALLRRLTEKVP
jgi:hypothetical protein